MDTKRFYTALSRTTNIELVRINNKMLLPMYKTRKQPSLELTNVHGSAHQNEKIYEVTFEKSDRIYVGCTCDEIETRLKWHLSSKKSQVYALRSKGPQISLVLSTNHKARKLKTDTVSTVSTPQLTLNTLT